ncbi:CD5 antigen-like isoform X3 [Lissotriton helveticus]
MLGHIVFLLLALRASAVFCPDCDDTDVVRLANAADPCAGVVLVTIDNIEGTICDSSWDMNDAAVVCRQLGCGAPISAPGGSVFGIVRNTSPRISNVGCRGDESSVLKCSYSYRPPVSCVKKRDASVQCTGPDQVRVVNGPSFCAGRVEVRHNGAWGTVCDDSWDQKDASVFCRQLGCGAVQSYQYNSSFGISPLPVLMSDVQCQGDESALWKCAQRGWDVNTCPTGRNAGVTCAGEADTVRLVNSGDACRGRVEIKHENRWGTVCDSDWDMKDAEVVCRQLNCGSASRAETRNDIFLNGVFPVWMSDVKCTGAEESLFDCPRASCGINSCPWRSDGGVQCSGDQGYALGAWRMTPVCNPTTPGQRQYNAAQICTRSIVERTFGVLKSRFRCLDITGGSLLDRPEMVNKIIMACCVLHNICVRIKAPWIQVPDPPDEDEEEEEAGAVNPTPNAAGLARRNRIINNYFA